MNASLLKSLRESLDSTHEQYNLHFAGQMRATRSPDMMRLMIEAAEAISRDTKRVEANGDAAEKQSLLDMCSERLALYQSELAAIESARKTIGRDGLEAALLGTRANFIFHRYIRHFAGQDRGTRDLGLLAEMTADLHAISDQMAALANGPAAADLEHDRAVVAEYIELFSNERGAVLAARDSGTLEDQAGRLANLANDQFHLYSMHFAGRARVSRRPELLERMIGTLESVIERMKGLQQIGHHSEHNAGNIAIVAERLADWRSELAAVREQRQSTPLLTMVEALGEAVEPVLATYNEEFAGLDRLTRELGLLTVLCDALGELERQMERIGSVEQLTANERNLQMVRDAMVMFEKEWQAIAEAKTEAAPSE